MKRRNIQIPKITTQIAKSLLSNGWVLKEHKDQFNLHSFYIYNPETKRAKYFNKQIFNNLKSIKWDA